MKNIKYGNIRRSIRLKGYDYAQAGAYFVTICIQDRLQIFGEVTNGKMFMNNVGEMADKWWSKLPEKFPAIVLDGYIIMPNHMHGIIIINQPSVPVGADPRVCPGLDKHTDDNTDEYTGVDTDKHTGGNTGKHMGLPLQRVIQWFKTMTTNEYIRNVNNTDWKPFNKRFWQRNYYEHIIRNEKELNRIQEYILHNPIQWQFDRENPDYVWDKNYDMKWNHIENMVSGKKTHKDM